jgi:hypothetical protein
VKCRRNLYYSDLNAIIGLTLDVRLAGNQHAKSATETRKSADSTTDDFSHVTLSMRRPAARLLTGGSGSLAGISSTFRITAICCSLAGTGAISATKARFGRLTTISAGKYWRARLSHVSLPRLSYTPTFLLSFDRI